MADWLRLRAVLDEQFAIVVAVLLVVAAGGGWLTYTTHVEPGTTTEERPASSWATSGWFNHSATVTEPNALYPVGTTLTNRSIYFAPIAPWFNGSYSFAYNASDGGDLNGTVALQFVLRHVERDREETTVVWRTTESLATASNDSMEPGNTIRVPFSIDVNRSMNRTELIQEDLDDPSGQPELVVRATVDLEGTVNGRDVERVAEHTLPIQLERGTYRLAHPGVVTDREQTTETVTVQRSYGPIRTVGSPVLLLVGLAGLVGVVAVRRRGELALSETERERLAYEDDREEFDEWISPVRLPDEAFDRSRAEAASLGALVDFAIDTGNAVVEDPDDDAYYVLHDGYLYTYRPPERPDEWSLRLLDADDGSAAESATPPETDGESPPTRTDEGSDSDGTETRD